MIAVNGIYDGKSVKILDKITDRKKYKVVVTFIEEISQHDSDLRNFSSQTSGLDFWTDPRENIYQDFLNHKSRKR